MFLKMWIIKVIFELSEYGNIVCTCNHLTNFGIILDWKGDANAVDPGNKSSDKQRRLCSKTMRRTFEKICALGYRFMEWSKVNVDETFFWVFAFFKSSVDNLVFD